MTVIDYIIILILLSGGVAGAKNGFFKQSVVLIGTILCFILAWVFKNPIANFLSFTLPFWDFGGLTSLNIVLYQLIAFLLLLALFSAILAVLIKMTGIFEKILKMTIILGIPSKILGFFVGILEAYIIVFVILFFMHQPIFSDEIFEGSKLEPVILESSPGLSHIVGNMNNAVNDIYNINKNYVEDSNKDQFNKQVIESLLNNKVINQDYINKLNKKGKLKY